MATALAGKLFIVNKALCADKYTATLKSCAYCYLSTEEEKDAENGTKRRI